MKIVIPMSGSGNRFIEAGYQDPKPLIKVDGILIIEYVTKMFPGEPDENFIFICRNEHLEKTEMRKILNNLKPNAKIIETQPAKLGPVYAVTKAFDFIDDEEQVIEIQNEYVPYSVEFGTVALGKKYGVTNAVIGRIIRGVAYKNVY